jgi:uncharacterized surface protein with fasciclin (FAS1) repeats
MKHTPQRLFAALIVGAMTFAACGSDGNDAAPVETEVAAEVGTIVDVAVANGSFDTLVAAVIAADLAETLSSHSCSPRTRPRSPRSSPTTSFPAK